MTRLSRRDWALIAVCIVLAAAAIAIVSRYWHTAFPEASIDFKYDRTSSRTIAERLVSAQRIDVQGMKHAVRFDSDDQARIFLERSLGVERAAVAMRDGVQIWTWHHRWFRPLVEEELSVDVAPTGAIVGFAHKIPEERAIADGGAAPPVAFLKEIGVNTKDLHLISMSERRLPRRMQRIYTWESRSIRPAGATYRHTVTVDGNRVSAYAQHLKVPDAWLRSYRELRSKNAAAGSVDGIFTFITAIAAVVVFVIRLRRGDLHLRFLLTVGLAGLVLVGGVALNSIPEQLAYYDTTESYSAYVGRTVLWTIVESLGTAMMLIIICGAGEVLYRERLPKQLAIPRLWTRKALGSRRVFLGLIVGYALVPLFIAYQVVFYLAARRAGAWAPAEVPYDEMLNSALPWVAVLFAGFFPAFSEEFLSRAFSIPFFQRLLRSRLAAIVLAGFIWGFGHSMYPNQPFWIRGVEVGLVGVAAGFLMDRFGLLPLLIWHYTIDAVYTATLLFGSGNTYYIASAALASLIFAIPLLAAIALYVRNGGFVPDDDLLNETLPLAPVGPPPSATEDAGNAEYPGAAAAGGATVPVTRTRILVCVAVVAMAAIAIAMRPASVEDAIDYRITKEQAKDIARAHVRGVATPYAIAAPVEGFRSWDASSAREEGGAPGGFDSIAATYLVQNGMRVDELARVFRERIEAGTWSVRFFTPMKKEEIFVEIDPRTSRPVGYHKYQDERNAGPALAQDAALAHARNAFARYGLDARAFEVKEALTFQQPARRDWLFHFEERTPLAARAYRRVTVRVAGAEVTQFHRHIKVPDSVYRAASTQTLLNVVLVAMKIAGMLALLSLVIAGIVIASRTHGLPWRRAMRWTLALAVIPMASILARYELLLFGYQTSTSWETFRVRLISDVVLQFGMQLGVLFLALAGLEAAAPYARSLVSREGRARFGRGAAMAAVTAVALLAIADVAMRWLELSMPRAASVDLSVSESVSIPFPALIDGAQALVGALVISGAAALYGVTVRRHAALITITAIFCASVDPGVMPEQAPLMLIRAALLALLAWGIARYVLNGNPLAWPLTVFVVVAVQTATTLLSNHRPDLLAHGIALVAFAALALLWAGMPRSADA